MVTSHVFYAVCEENEAGEWVAVEKMHRDRAHAEEDFDEYPDGFLVQMTWTRCQAVSGRA